MVVVKDDLYPDRVPLGQVRVTFEFPPQVH